MRYTQNSLNDTRACPIPPANAIDNAGSPDGNAVMPIFSSPHFRQNWGHTLLSDFSLVLTST